MRLLSIGLFPVAHSLCLVFSLYVLKVVSTRFPSSFIAKVIFHLMFICTFDFGTRSVKTSLRIEGGGGLGNEKYVTDI